MRPVGVHLDDDRRAARERDAEPVEVRLAQALLRLAMPDADPRVVRAELLGQRAGPVGRAVVDDEQRRAGQALEDRGRDPGQVLRLVVGRQDDPCALAER